MAANMTMAYMFNQIYSYNVGRESKGKRAIRSETKAAHKKEFAQRENPANVINISLWQFIQHVVDIVELIRNKLHDWGCRISFNRYLKYSYYRIESTHTHTCSSNILCTIYRGLITFRFVVCRKNYEIFHPIGWLFSINRKGHCVSLYRVLEL